MDNTLNNVCVCQLYNWDNNNLNIPLKVILKQFVNIYQDYVCKYKIESELQSIPTYIDITDNNYKYIYQSLMTDNKTNVYLAIQNLVDTFDILGFCKTHRIYNRHYIESIYVKEPYRRNYIGTKIISYMEDNIKKLKNNNTLHLTIYPSDPISIKFFKSLNFHTSKICLKKHVKSIDV